MSLLKGIHHVSVNCVGKAEFEKTVAFYRDTLGMPVAHAWPGAVMLAAGESCIEIFDNAVEKANKGIITHFAFATDDVDACVKAVREAGYEVFIEPNNVDIASDPVFPVRYAFCHGPVGEEIEFFQLR